MAFYNHNLCYQRIWPKSSRAYKKLSVFFRSLFQILLFETWEAVNKKIKRAFFYFVLKMKIWGEGKLKNPVKEAKEAFYKRYFILKGISSKMSMLLMKNWCSSSCLFIFKIHVTQAGWVFLLLACIQVCLFINLLNCPWPPDRAKNYRPQIWYKNSPWAYLKTIF